MENLKLDVSHSSNKSKGSSSLEKLFQLGASDMVGILEKEEFKFRKSLVFTGLISIIYKNEEKVITHKVDIGIIINRFLILVDGEVMKGIDSSKVKCAFFYPLLKEIRSYFSPIDLSSLDYKLEDDNNSFHIMTLEYPLGDIAEQISSFGEVSFNRFSNDFLRKRPSCFTFITYFESLFYTEDSIRIRDKWYRIRVSKFQYGCLYNNNDAFLMVQSNVASGLNKGFLLTDDGILVGSYSGNEVNLTDLLSQLEINSPLIRNKMRMLNDKTALSFLKIPRFTDVFNEMINDLLREIETGERKLPGKKFEYDVSK